MGVKLQAVLLIWRSQVQRCPWHNEVKPSGIINTSESDSPVSKTPRNQICFSYFQSFFSNLERQFYEIFDSFFMILNQRNGPKFHKQNIFV